MNCPTQTKPSEPLYDPSKTKPAYHLRYSWTGWPSQRKFQQMPVKLLDSLKPLWETDGIRLLEHRWTDDKVQLLFSTKPDVSPMTLAARAKGRLDHAIRGAGLRMPLSRKLAVRSIGDNTRQEVEAYIESQVGKQQFMDANFEAFLRQFTISNVDVDLSKPSESVRGRYWYNLHVVLVTAERFRIVDATRLTTLRDSSIRIAEKKGYLISRLSVMPDHLHVALRGDHEHSPNQVVYSFQNNLAHAVGAGRIWCEGFYVGTFSEYNMEAIRRNLEPR